MASASLLKCVCIHLTAMHRARRQREMAGKIETNILFMLLLSVEDSRITERLSVGVDP